MKDLKVRTRVGALLVSGFVLAGSYGIIAKAKDNSDYELKTTPIAEMFEDEKICNLTTLDEEMATGNIDLIDEDTEFRKNIMDLEYYESSGEMEKYDNTLNWLRFNIKKTSKELLLGSAKGAIADAENKETSDINLTSAPDYNEDYLFIRPKGVAEVKTDYYSEGYVIDSKQLNEAINLYSSIQDTDFEDTSAKDIIKLYDQVIKTSKMTIASGANRHHNKIEEKNTKKYIKKNYDI